MSSPTEIWFLGETKGFWVNTGALVISILVASAAIWVASKRERKRSTLEFLNSRHRDTALLEAIRFVRHGQVGQKGWLFLLQPDNSDAEKVKMALNYHEFVAQSIMQKALDEAMYKQMQYTNLMNFWKASEPAIRYLRAQTNTPTLYQDMEWLVRRWQDHPIIKNEDRLWI